MIVYAQGSRGFKLWESKKRGVVVLRDVRFDESDELRSLPEGNTHSVSIDAEAKEPTH